MADVQVYRVVWGPEERAKAIAEGWSEIRDPDGEYIPHTALPEIEQAIRDNAAAVDATEIAEESAQDVTERAEEAEEAQEIAVRRGRKRSPRKV